MVLGVIGLGRIGRAVARKAQGFGLTVKGIDPYVPDSELKGTGIVRVSFEELTRTADFISLNVLLTKETYHLIDAKALAAMKNTVYIINTCRGEVIDESALVDALKAQKIGGAGLDVLTQEPPDPRNPLLNMPNVIVTPHSAYVSLEARLECKWRAIKAVADALEGRVPEDLINPEVLKNRRP
jgi:D-3-phosphoglycerate dehydrogenase